MQLVPKPSHIIFMEFRLMSMGYYFSNGKYDYQEKVRIDYAIYYPRFNLCLVKLI